MQIMNLGRKERKLLLDALGFDILNLKCQFCGEKTVFEDCCIMPAMATTGDATILCDSILCMAEYLEVAERTQ